MIVLHLPEATYAAVQEHLVPKRHRVEEAGFLYVVPAGDDAFTHVDWYAVPPTGFLSRSAYHLELSDETRAGMIKRAHDLGASLVELHSHVGNGDARFSPSDLAGFLDFVPHVFWRLKSRPYLAVVMTRSGFDAFAWTRDASAADRLHGIQVGDRLLTPTGLSRFPQDPYDEQPL